MNTTRICPRCGAKLGMDAPQGLCPACLLRQVGESATVQPGATDFPAGEALPGQRFGDYELIEEIARGGMGVVWRARQAGLNREVALKMILSGRFASEEEVRRFRTEAEAAAQLQHPNIVAIHEFGERDGAPFFTMDFVRGRSLADVCAERPLTSERAAAYLKTIAEAVHFAHQRGVVHRDLKPGNVLIDATDAPRITDFGLAKMISRDSDLTLTGTVMGSPGYMAPEQAQGKSDLIGPRSDVYSLGAILYEALTARPPFRAATPLETMKQVVEAEPASPSQVNPAVPRDLDTICLKCLEKDPARRYATARVFAEELDRFLRHEPIHSRPATVAERTRKWAKRKPAVAALVAVSALAFVGFLIGGLWFYGNLRDRLADTYLEQTRLERRAGRRAEALAHIQNAASIRPDGALRAEAIQALAMPTMRRIFERTNGAIFYLAFSPDGQRLAIAFETLPMAIDAAPWTHEVSVWDMATGAKMRRIDADLHAGTIAWSPDGRTLALPQGDGTTALWEPTADKVRAALPASGAVLFNSDGGQMAIFTTNDVQVFKVTNGVMLARHTNGVARAFASTNRLFVQIKEMLSAWDFAANQGRCWRCRSSTSRCGAAARAETGNCCRVHAYRGRRWCSRSAPMDVSSRPRPIPVRTTVPCMNSTPARASPRCRAPRRVAGRPTVAGWQW
jgi:tRNA A-37 threonylcarbamoyl transferase component Bud32